MTTTDLLTPKRRDIKTVDDVESIRKDIEQFAEAKWETEETARGIRCQSWDDWTYRFEKSYPYDLPENFDDPAMKRIQEIARGVWREMSE